VQKVPETCRANDERNKEYSVHLVGHDLNSIQYYQDVRNHKHQMYRAMPLFPLWAFMACSLSTVCGTLPPARSEDRYLHGIGYLRLLRTSLDSRICKAQIPKSRALSVGGWCLMDCLRPILGVMYHGVCVQNIRD
jgi:hypothetical protein